MLLNITRFWRSSVIGCFIHFVFYSQKTARALSDSEVMLLVEKNAIPSYQIEKAVGDLERAVGIRRQIVAKLGEFSHALSDLPYHNYDYSKVYI